MGKGGRLWVGVCVGGWVCVVCVCVAETALGRGVGTVGDDGVGDDDVCGWVMMMCGWVMMCG